jgi:beta-barrel assembly-enhancing protease
LKRLLAGVAVALVALGGEALGYPIAEERKLGDRFSIEAAGALQIVRDPAVVAYVNGIGQQIVARLDPPQPFEYRFSVVNDGSINAFAVPGGFVYVNSGLLLRVGNDAELAGVLGHEIGHSHAHHVVRQQEKSQFLNYAALAGMLLSIVHPAIGAAAMGANATGQLKYQREFEQEADYLGMRYMRAAGYDPHGMVSFMKRLSEEQRTMPIDQIPPYMLSHPMTDERMTNLEAATRGMPTVPGSQKPSFALERVQAIVRALDLDRGTRARYERASAAGGRALALYGIVLLYQGELPAALSALGRAKTGGVADLDDDIAGARFRAGDLDGAALVLRGRVEAAPDDAEARALLGQVLLTKGDYAGAIRELDRARALVPALDQVEYDLGQAYGKNGDPARGFYHLARALEMRGDAEQARAQYAKSAKLFPPDSDDAAEASQRVAILEEIAHSRVIGR